MTDSDAQTQAFSVDRPIAAPSQDLLGRGEFARALARAIGTWRGSSGLVVGLFGPWGAGKTSLANLVVAELHESSDPQVRKPIVIRFNPWQFSKHTNLTTAFFAEVGTALAKQDDPGAKAIARLLRQFPRYLRVSSSAAALAEAIYDAVQLALVVAIALVQMLWIRIVLALTVVLVGLLAKFSSKARRILTKAASFLDDTLGGRPKSLEERKKVLSEALLRTPMPLLIILDDVDRLTAAEVREALQLVKVNADFPNVVYMVLAERDALERSIERHAPISGRDFVAKIFQVQFDVPLPHHRKVANVLTGKIDALIGSSPEWTREEQNRWRALFNGLLPYFQTLRDVNRFLGSFEFQLGLLAKNKATEINLIDLIAGESLRLFEPDAFSRLRQLRGELLSSHESDRAERLDAARAAMQSLLQLVQEQRRTSFRQVVMSLFPRSAQLLGEREQMSDEQLWVRERRICAEPYFDRYFAFAVRDDELSERDVEFVREHMNDTEALTDHFAGLSRRGLLRALLERLEAHKSHLPLTHAVQFVAAFMALGDSLEPEALSIVGTDMEMHVRRIVHWYLMQETDSGRRAIAFSDAARTSGAVLVPGLMAAAELDRRSERRSNADYLFSEDGARMVATTVGGVIGTAATNGALARHPRLARVLFAWSRVASEDTMREWATQLVSTPEGTLALLVGALQRGFSQTAGERLGRLSVRLYLGELKTFVNLDLLERAVAVAREHATTPEQQDALRAYDRAKKREAAGLPDSPRLDDEDETS